MTWACLKKLRYFPCLSEALINEMMGVVRMSRQSRKRKVGQESRERDLLGDFINLTQVIQLQGLNAS